MAERWDVYEPQEMESDDSGSRTRGQAGRGQDGFSAKEASVSGFGGQHGPKASELGGEFEDTCDMPCSLCNPDQDGGMGHATNEYRVRHDDDDDR